MTSTAVIPSERIAPRRVSPTVDVAAAAAWLLPFVLVVVLAFSGGGYDAIVRGQAGLLVWWLVLVGAAAGTLVARGNWPVWLALALLGAFTAWTTVGLIWTESAGRTVAEVARVTSLLGVLVLAICSQQRVAARHAVNGTACAIGLVAAAAVLSRLKPNIFGPLEIDAIFPGSRPRLSYPLGYWNLLAGLAAMGVPLLLAAAGSARTAVGRALATTTIPIVALCIFLTVSRGALGAAAVALALYLVLAPDRLPKLANAAVAAAGSLVLCLAADHRDALQQNLGDATARQQGTTLLGLTALVCLGVALLAGAIALAERHATRPGWTRASRRVSGTLTLVVVLLAAVAFVGTGGPGALDDRVDQFKTQADSTGASGDNAVARLGSVTGNGRYQYWQSAQRAEETAPLHGTGPGTFEFWWARDSTIDNGFVRDAHSLWFQALAETGSIGAVLIASFFLVVLLAGAVRALRAKDDEHQTALAAATAGVGGFVACASVEWAWQMTVLPVAALGLAAVALAGRSERGLLPSRQSSVTAQPPVRARIGFACMAVAAIAAIGIPTAAAGDLRDSQVKASNGDLRGALEAAASAAALQPYNADVHVQEALVLERAGELRPALAAALRATQDEPTNWRPWVIRSRLEARTGRPAASVRSYERARNLNPRSALFLRP